MYTGSQHVFGEIDQSIQITIHLLVRAVHKLGQLIVGVVVRLNRCRVFVRVDGVYWSNNARSVSNC